MQNVLGNLNVVFDKIFGSVEKDVFNTIDEILVIDKDIFEKEPLEKILNIDGLNYMALIANALIIMYAIYYIFLTFISMYNGAKRGNIYKFILKLIVIAILANSAIFLCQLVVEINYGFTYAVDSIGKKASGNDLNFASLKEKILSIEDYLKDDNLSLSGIIKGMISFGSVSILLSFAVRYVIIILLIFISPIAIICLSSNLTEGIFYTYIKAFIINLMVQNVAKIVILIPLTYNDTGSIMYKVVLAGSIYIIYKLNSYVKQLFSRITSGQLGKGEN